MISSGAFPNVALRKPPIPGPVFFAACSVASPISHASGISEIAASTNSSTSLGWKTNLTRIVNGARPSDAQRSLRATRAKPTGPPAPTHA